AAKMRAFESRYKQLEQQASLRGNQGIESYESINEREKLDFRNQFLGQAEAYREQLETRLNVSAGSLSPCDSSTLIAFQGFLAGVSPISDAADYLEKLARTLSPQL
ncbi:MAG: hypothetical protein WB676_28360, partial [Bryobacteraceae bacterium]